MRHRFQRRQAKSFVERRKEEDVCDVVENPQYLDGHEAEKADVIAYAAANDGAPQIGMAGKIIPNDDQLQIGELVLLLQFSPERRKGFDDAHEILVRTDSSRIQ